MLKATWDLAGPVYYRLGKDDRTRVPGLDGHFQLGRANTLRSGNDFLIVTTGTVTKEVMKAADILDAKGVDGAVL